MYHASQVSCLLLIVTTCPIYYYDASRPFSYAMLVNVLISFSEVS